MENEKQYVIVKDRYPRISEVLNDCVGQLCVVTYKDEPLSSVLKKICAKITSIESSSSSSTEEGCCYTFEDSDSVTFSVTGSVVSAEAVIGGAGTVTSLSLSPITSFALATGSPVTTSGTIGYSLIAQPVNTVFAGPASGGSAVPTFRALVPGDISGVGTVTSITASSPLTGGVITTSGSIGIGDAAADGTTKGAATFTAADFNSSSGLISIDYVNAQAATASQKGFLTSTDWTTFNEKLSPFTFFGELYNKTTWANLSDFTVNGATASVVANQIDFSGGAGNIIQSIDINRYTNLEHWKMVGKVKMTSSGAWFGLGMRSYTANNPTSLVGHLNTATGTSIITNGVTGAVSATNLTISVNDEVEMSMELDGDKVTMIVKNITTSSASITTTYTYNLPTVIMPNSGKLGVFSVSGTFTLESLLVNSNEIVGAHIMTVGDSKTKGYSTTFAQRYSTLLSTYFETVVSAGVSETTADLINRLPEIVALKPKVVLLAIGSNDIRFGVSTPTWQANYATIVNTLTAAGIYVIHLLSFYETAISVTPLVNFINATYLPADIIDTYTPMQAGGMLNVDGIHPSTQGNIEAIYGTIMKSYKLLRVRGQKRIDSSSIQNQTASPQDAGFYVSQASRISNSLEIGPHTSGIIDLTIHTASNNNIKFYNAGGINNISSLTDLNGSTTSMQIQGSVLNMYSAGVLALGLDASGYGVFNSRVGIGGTPTEALHVGGNIRLSGALMPNNLPGTSGQILTSGGSGAPATWNNLTWNSLVNPTGDQTLAFGTGFSTTWTSNNQTEDLFTINTSLMTTASLLSVNSTSTNLAAGNNLAEFIMSGLNLATGVTATGVVISVTNTNGTSGTNIGLDVTATGATTRNVALNVTGGAGSSSSFAAQFNGRVAMGGVTTPFSDLDVGNGTLSAGQITVTTAAGTNQTGNFSTGAQGLVGSNVGSIYQILGSSNINAHVFAGGTGATAVGIGLPGATMIIGASQLTEAASGTHPLFAGLILMAPTVSNQGATLTNTATLYIDAAPAGTVSGQNMAVWIDAGNSRFDANILIGTATPAASATTTLHLGNGTAPSASITDGVLLYAEDVAASSELKVRDEAGNVTTLSPHNFSKIPKGRSEKMAWAHYSEKDGEYINVDILKLARILEKLSGEKLVYIGKLK